MYNTWVTFYQVTGLLHASCYIMTNTWVESSCKAETDLTQQFVSCHASEQWHLRGWILKKFWGRWKPLLITTSIIPISTLKIPKQLRINFRNKSEHFPGKINTKRVLKSSECLVEYKLPHHTGGRCLVEASERYIKPNGTPDINR